jgi:prepilin-type processing-associated H-X9-DG protein
MSDEPWLPAKSDETPLSPALATSSPLDAFLSTWILWPYVGYVLLLSWFFSWCMPLFGAIPLAIIVAVVFYLFNGVFYGGYTLQELAVGATIGVFLLAFGAFTLNSGRYALVEKTCLKSLKQSGQAISLYSVDYDDHLPPSDRWTDAIVSYLSKFPSKSPVVKGMPRCAPNNPAANYAFDSRLSTQPLPKVWLRETTVILYDSTSREKNAHDAGSSLPRPGRHRGHNNFLYADGHAGQEQ